MKIKQFIEEAIGWYGTVAIISAFALVRFEILEPTNLLYQALNGTGALGIVFCYTIIMTTESIKNKIVPILKRQGVTKAAFFGSFARGEAGKRSDIDILVKLKKGKSLFDFVGLKFELEEKLEKKVDLVTYGSIKPRLKDIILKDEKIIYEKRS